MNKLITFVKEAWLELKQVSWLSVPQMTASTVVVIVLVIVMSIYLFAVDTVLAKVMAFLV